MKREIAILILYEVLLGLKDSGEREGKWGDWEFLLPGGFKYCKWCSHLTGGVHWIALGDTLVHGISKMWLGQTVIQSDEKLRKEEG